MKDLTGKIFGELEVLYPTEKRTPSRLVIWKCKCSCGELCEATSRDLIRGHKKSCGHLYKTVLPGERYGKLEVLYITSKRTSIGDIICHCKCDCGNECDVNSRSMKAGRTLSCGCIHKETAKINGQKTTLDLTNKRFGRIVALSKTSDRVGSNVKWLCKCDCGNQLKISTSSLRAGAIISCGCLKSSGEEKIIHILTEAKILFKHNYCVKVFNRNLYFDFAIISPETKQPLYFIEYDGKQHFLVGGWNTEEKLKNTIFLDSMKDTWCKDNSIPLIRISYKHFDDLSLKDLCLETSSFILPKEFSSWSILCRYMWAHIKTWESDFKKFKIRVKKSDNLVILNYTMGCDFNNFLCKEARGIIIDISNFSVQCVGFNKFFNYFEVYADKIDWNTARVQTKVDGSIIKYWYSKKLDKWVWSTNACIYADEANTESGRSFQKIIESTLEYSWISHYGEMTRNKTVFELDKDCTYIFELVSPDNQVVVNYPEARLWHIGTRNNVTGEESKISIGIQKPKEYPLQSLEECVDAAKALNQNDYPDFEGFVVCDSKYNRIKVKSPEYLVWHHAVNNGVVTKELAYELINSDDFDLTLIKENIPEFNLKRILYYMDAFEQSKVEIEQLVAKVRFLSSLDKTRKEIAMEIKDDPKSYYGFKALDSGLSAQELIKSLGVNSFLKTIKDFSE